MEIEKFKKDFKPIKQHNTTGIDKYLLDPRKKDDKMIIFGTYEMFVWTYTEDNTIVNGRKLSKAKAYLITENHHDVEEHMEVTLTKQS
jgi:hypothetical protein